MNAAVRPEPLAPYRAAYDGTRAHAGITESMRAAAFARFVELGFPAARDEAWKYTSLRRLETRSFALPGPAGVSAPLPTALASHVLVLENGALQVARSTPGALPHGVRVRTLEQVEADGEPLAPLLRVPPGGGTERFVALNAALCRDVVVIDVAAGARPEAALHLAVTATGARENKNKEKKKKKE